MNLRNRTREEDSKACVTSVTISFVETTLRQISLSFKQFFVKDHKTLVSSDDHSKTRK